MSHKNVNPKITLKPFKVVCQYDSRVAWNVLFQFVVIALLITRLLCDLCYLYFAQHTENVFARETRSLVRERIVRENETRRKKIVASNNVTAPHRGGEVERLSTKSRICLDAKEPDKNHQHQIRNALSYVESNQLLI